MDASKQKKYYNQGYYTEGNTVRKLQAVPRYTEEEEQQKRKHTVTRKKQRVESGIDIVSCLLMTVAIVFTLYTCVDFLSAQTKSTQLSSKIASLESNLSKLKNQNNTSLSEMNSSVDLKYIYKVATKELGMIYPDNKQVITYKSTLSDYVKQYRDIPEEDNSSFLAGIKK